MCVCVFVCVCLLVCVCVCACVRACVRASDSSETVEVKLGTVPASDMVIRHVLTILTLTLIHGHAYLNHESKKRSIIPETVHGINPK